MSNRLLNTTLRGSTDIVGQLSLPNGSITNASVASGADIDADKIVHRQALSYYQADGSSVTAAEVPIHVARGTTGTIVAIDVAIMTAASGDAEVDVDLKKGSSGSSFSSVLTGVITVDSGTSVRDPEAGTLDTTSFTEGDILMLDINVDAGSGSLPQGMVVTVTIDETPN